MNYAARLAKIERLAGKGMCPICRLIKRHRWLDQKKPQPKPIDSALIITFHCEVCGAVDKRDLSGYSEGFRDMMRLHCLSTLEESYTNPRAWAAQLWLSYWVAAEREQRKVKREIRALSDPNQTPYARQKQDYARQQKFREREQAAKKDPDVKLYNKLKGEAQALNERRHKRLQRQYGKNPFPELKASFDAVKHPDYRDSYKDEPYAHDVPFSPMFDLEREALLWLKCAELEKTALGEVTAYTTGQIADCERRAQEVIAVGRAKYEAREEQRRQEEARRQAELEERRRVEEEARQRAEEETARKRAEEERTDLILRSFERQDNRDERRPSESLSEYRARYYRTHGRWPTW